jgi:hypothetical protein
MTSFVIKGSSIFWIILAAFRFVLQGSYTKLILPLQNKSKGGSKEPENRQNLDYEGGQMTHPLTTSSGKPSPLGVSPLDSK